MFSLATGFGATRLAIHQSDFGARSPKPTGFILNFTTPDDFGVIGWPEFDAHGKYIGPFHCVDIPSMKPGAQHIRPTAEYPRMLCERLADMICSAIHDHTFERHRPSVGVDRGGLNVGPTMQGETGITLHEGLSDSSKK